VCIANIATGRVGGRLTGARAACASVRPGAGRPGLPSPSLGHGARREGRPARHAAQLQRPALPAPGEHPVGCYTSAGHEDSVEAVGLSQHLPLAASCSLDGKLLIWDCGTLSQRLACEHPTVRGVCTGRLPMHTWRTKGSTLARASKGFPVLSGDPPHSLCPASLACAVHHAHGVAPRTAAGVHRMLGRRVAMLGPAHGQLRADIWGA
jgi:hypothetical protein